jgi:hypothetical protein
MSCDQTKRIGVTSLSLSLSFDGCTESYRCIVRELKHDSYDAENEPAQKLRNSIKFQISTARSRLSLSLLSLSSLSLAGSLLMGPLWESNGQEVLHFLFAPSQSLAKATQYTARALSAHKIKQSIETANYS